MNVMSNLQSRLITQKNFKGAFVHVGVLVSSTLLYVAKGKTHVTGIRGFFLALSVNVSKQQQQAHPTTP